MASTMHIHEDVESRATRRSPVKEGKKNHKRTPSVGAILRGRRLKENDPSKTEPVEDHRQSRERPLAERHINSPPHPHSQRLPLNDSDERPNLHKRTKSAVSLRGLIGSSKLDTKIETSSDNRKGDDKVKGPKQSTNLGGLLRKRSAKGLREEATKERPAHAASTPTTPFGGPQSVRSPIWEQFATQPFEDPFGRVQSPERSGRTIAEEIALYTPKDGYKGGDGYFPASYNCMSPAWDEKPPQRPYLEHKSSRSSIFKEEGMDNESPVSYESTRDDGPASPSKVGRRPAMGSRPNSSDQPVDTNAKRVSKVMTAINTLTSRAKDSQQSPEKPAPESLKSPEEIDAAFETVLESRNIPHNMRDKMRSMDLKIKADFVKSHRVESGASTTSTMDELRPSSRSPNKKEISKSPKKNEKEQIDSKRSRSRPRSRAFTLSKGDSSPSKKQKSSEDTPSRSRAKSFESGRPGSSRSIGSSSRNASPARPASATRPGDFVQYLREVQQPELVEIGKIHKLRILLRNESVSWTDTFITEGGMDEIVSLLYRIIQVEWREEHEDTLLHETLLCLKGLCTTELALKHLTMIESTLFPKLLGMLFDPERKGPAEFSTRGIITSLLFMHLSAATPLPQPDLTLRVQTILSYLADPSPEEGKQPLDFISQMHVSRPYRVWCKEIVNVTKEVFWIFLHHLNVIPLVTKTPDSESASSSSSSYLSLHYPSPPPPHPAAPYVGGVEWEATLYLATHLDLLNGLIASTPTPHQRNAFRQELRDSGFERVMGATMRTAKEKFYGHMHAGLKTWVAAAHADGWEVIDVREGPPKEPIQSSPKKSPKKKDAVPKLDVKIGGDGGAVGGGGDMGREDLWL